MLVEMLVITSLWGLILIWESRVTCQCGSFFIALFLPFFSSWSLKFCDILTSYKHVLVVIRFLFDSNVVSQKNNPSDGLCECALIQQRTGSVCENVIPSGVKDLVNIILRTLLFKLILQGLENAIAIHNTFIFQIALAYCVKWLERWGAWEHRDSFSASTIRGWK